MPQTSTTPPDGGMSVSAQALQAQTALLPHALAVFAVTLPAYVWAGSHAPNAAWMSASFVIFAIAWGCFYGVVNWLKSPAAADNRRRARVQILAGLIWACAVAQVAAFADGAGAARETLLLASLGAAIVCVIFTSPWLPSLMIVAPVALAGPLAALLSRPQSHELGRLSWGATATALALALLVNRILRRQFALAAEREALVAERAAQAEAARRLARSKSDLVATLGDEVRNGLTAVAQMLDAAAGGGRQAPSREHVKAAVAAVDELMGVLDTTLDAESAEAGRLQVEARPFDLAAVARDVTVVNRAAAAARGLEVTLHVDADAASGAAVGDPARVRQVLAALVGNAIKFTLRGRVEARVARAGHDRIAVQIADTGPGLTEDELARAFAPFQRIARTSAGASGAGLGLTLARQLARLMGGDLSAESAPGVGSCFTLVLPYAPTACAEPAAPAQAGPARRLRILVVEDDPLGAAMLRAGLEQLGHQVVCAADGPRGLDLARVCDLDLAMIRGPQTIDDLRALDGGAGRTPVVALVSGDAQDAQACREAGADALLRKPVTVAAAARALAEALAPRRPANDRQAA